MFERITIRDVAGDESSTISITFSVPGGWCRTQEEDWLAFQPRGRNTHGFALLMSTLGASSPERLLNDLDGLHDYIQQTIPQLQPLKNHPFDLDVFAPYDLAYFRGSIPGVGGKVILVGTAISVDDVNFALFCFSRDEEFEDHDALFQRIIMSFQPMVQAR